MKRRNLVNPARTPAARDRHIYGTHAVLTWLQTRPEQLRRVSYAARLAHRFAEILALATQAQVPHEPCSDETLTRMAGTSRHQGVVASAAPFAYTELDRLIASAPRLLVLADHIQDPHNLGAIVRSADAAGAGALLIPKDSSVGVTATVEVAAAGAAAALPVCRVTNAVRALQQLKAAGYWTIGLVAHGGIDLYRFDPPERVVVVVGGETGMRPLVAKHCDFAVSIPMRGTVESLNASVATAVVLYEIVRRWVRNGATIVSGGRAV